ncbi:MAG: hypothetical protein RL440_196 [Bacteroidota bacterium]|jgi:hypothetical protein
MYFQTHFISVYIRKYTKIYAIQENDIYEYICIYTNLYPIIAKSIIQNNIPVLNKEVILLKKL